MSNLQVGEGSASMLDSRDANTNQAGPSDSLSVSPRRFSTLSTDFRLPARSKTLASGSAAQQPPPSPRSTITIHSRNDDAFAGPSATASSHPLLRRSAVAAAVFANTNRTRLRRGSMLGREIARNTEILSSSDEDEDMDSDEEHRHQRKQSGDDVDNGKPAMREHALGRRTSSGTPPHLQLSRGEVDGNDIDMQLEAGDVSLESVRLESRSRATTPSRRSASPSEARSRQNSDSKANVDSAAFPQSLSSAMMTASSRRALSKRQSTPRDRDIQRVAASLKDETRPSETEIASEAKLQRHLIPKYESIGLATPRLLAVGARSPNARSRSSSAAGYFGQALPFPPGAERAFDDDDLAFHDHFYMGDEDDTSDEEEGIGSGVVKTSIAVPPGAAQSRFDEPTMEDEQCAGNSKGIAIPDATPKEFLWLGFRETTPGPRGSPGTERTLSRSARAATAGVLAGPSILEDKAGMDVEDSTTPISATLGPTLSKPVTGPSSLQGGNAWGKTMKRKLGDERFEPYAISLHKRRAVSPTAQGKLASPTLGGPESGPNASSMFPPRSRASTPTTTMSPHLFGNYAQSQTSPLTSHFTGSLTPGVLPNPTPLSIPSPTLAASQRHQYFGHGSFRAGSVVGVSTALSAGASVPIIDESPTASRPSTPNGNVGTRVTPSGLTPGTTPAGNPFAYSMPPAGPDAKSLRSMGATSSTAKGTGVTTPSTSAAAATGSGPGYGSGALGLSIGSGGRRFKEEQAAQEEEEGMLGDVSAIHLGEM